MSDNLNILPSTDPSAVPVATDNIAGKHIQRIKVTLGADGVNDGDVAVGNPMPVSVPLAVSATILTLTTAATGTNWTAFGSSACNALDLTNSTSVAIEYRRGGTGNAMQILSGASRLIVGISNANEIEVRRVDTSNTQVAVQAEALVA
jgi:hypothetical protein